MQTHRHQKYWYICFLHGTLQFSTFLWKIPIKLSLLRRSCPKSARSSPHIWLTLFEISSKSVHFRRSYCRMREDHFCPIEYLQYRLFEPIMIPSWLVLETLAHIFNVPRVAKRNPIVTSSHVEFWTKLYMRCWSKYLHRPANLSAYLNWQNYAVSNV